MQSVVSVRDAAVRYRRLLNGHLIGVSRAHAWGWNASLEVEKPAAPLKKSPHCLPPRLQGIPSTRVPNHESLIERAWRVRGCLARADFIPAAAAAAASILTSEHTRTGVGSTHEVAALVENHRWRLAHAKERQHEGTTTRGLIELTDGGVVLDDGQRLNLFVLSAKIAKMVVYLLSKGAVLNASNYLSLSLSLSLSLFLLSRTSRAANASNRPTTGRRPKGRGACPRCVSISMPHARAHEVTSHRHCVKYYSTCIPCSYDGYSPGTGYLLCDKVAGGNLRSLPYR